MTSIFVESLPLWGEEQRVHLERNNLTTTAEGR